MTGVMCGEDLNGNGLIEERAGELAACVGAFCPLGAVDCTPTYEPPSCLGLGVFDPVRDVCEMPVTWIDGTPFCPVGFSYRPGPPEACETSVMCASGTYDPAHDGCYKGNLACPLGSYPCGDSGAGHNQCSANPCVDVGATPPVDESGDFAGYRDDGAVDPATGSCSGRFLVFNGEASECLPPGYRTTWFDCCDTDWSRFWLIEENCTEPSIQTVQAVTAGRAVYVGSYCKTRIPGIGCLQRAKTHCLFRSKLARIIHEQGRPQLRKFEPGGWGTAKDPNCEGFTPEEFQALDFSRIDFSEFFGDLATPPPGAVQTEMQRKIDEFYDRL